MFLSQARNLAPFFAALSVVQAYGNNQNNQNVVNSDYSSLKVNCSDDVSLNLSIPYPEDTSNKIMRINAGSCNTTWEDIENNGGSKSYDSVNKCLKVTIPIEYCDLKKNVYSKPETSYRLGIYQPNIDIMFGDMLGDTEIIFRRVKLSVECGTVSEFTLEFKYNGGNGISSIDHDSMKNNTDGHDINGTFVFPSWSDKASFEILEYTNSSYEFLANTSDTRAKVTGDWVYLKIIGELGDDSHKWAVQNCSVSDGDQTAEILPEGTCKNGAVSLTGDYVDGEYRLQHQMFLLGSSNLDEDSASEFTLYCTVKVCDGADAENECNRLVEPCMEEDELERYACSGFDCSGSVCGFNGTHPICN